MKLLLIKMSIVSILLCSCVSIRTGERLEDYQDDIKDLTDELKKNPDDYDALRDLSIILVRTNQNDRARDFLAKAEKQRPDDPAILFHTGLNMEFLDKKKTAMYYYKKYSEVSHLSPYRKLMEGRYLWLSRDIVYADMKSRIERENELQFERTYSEAIAVFPLIYEGDDESYSPLSRGFSEMISIDLAKVKQLTILERIRLQALKDELLLGQNPEIDPTTAPRMGKLLGAGRILSGSFNIVGKERLLINLGSWNVETSQSEQWINKEGDLASLFQIEKQIVFSFIEQTGIELTPQEKEEIEYIPTQNLEAFLAYCKGLEMEDAGQFDRAASLFQNAVDMDPSFKTAGSQSESASSMSYSGGSKERIIDVARMDDPILKKPILTGGDLVRDRLEIVETDVRSNFIPGPDYRKPAQERDLATELTNLPDPPDPPNHSQ